jgi:hypothetical protein
MHLPSCWGKKAFPTIWVLKEDFISLTDMAKSQMQEAIIIKWLSLKNTIECLGA